MSKCFKETTVFGVYSLPLQNNFFTTISTAANQNEPIRFHIENAKYAIFQIYSIRAFGNPKIRFCSTWWPREMLVVLL